MDSTSHVPTVVVGLGGAGCEMAAAVDRRAAEEGVSDHVRVLGIDSRPEDAARALPTAGDESVLALSPPETDWERDRQRRPYLAASHELIPAGGTARQRPLGRYVVEHPEGIERTWQFLEGHLETFLSAAPRATHVDVWVVNSLAGGTGSGAFPLVAALLDEMLAELEAERGVDSTLRGVGSLWRLDRFAEQVRAPEGPVQYYLNAYTALSELQTLLGDETAEISLHPDAEQFVRREVDVGGVFERYLLAGVRNQERDHLDAVDETVADAIYYFGANRGVANQFPGGGSRIVSIDGAELAFPIETAERYVESREEIATAETELDRLEYERRALTADLNYLEAALSLDRHELPSPDAPVDRVLVRRCEDEVDRAVVGHAGPEERTGADAIDLVREHVDAVAANVREHVDGPERDGSFDPEAVVRYLVLDRLVTTVRRERDRAHEKLDGTVATLLDAHRESLLQYLDADDLDRLQSNPERAAERLEAFLVNERERLVGRREEPLRVLTDPFGHLDTRIEETTEAIEELDERRSAYEHLKNLARAGRLARNQRRETLRETRDEVEDDRHGVDDKIGEQRRELETLRRRRERIGARLEDSTTNRRRTTVAIERPDRLDAAFLELVGDDGFGALVEATQVERERVESQLEAVCLGLDEPVQDRLRASSPDSVLAPMLADEWMDAVQGASALAGFDAVASRVDTETPATARLLGLYGNVDLDATSEFGALEEYATDADRELRDLFGPGFEDVSRPSSAYPEL